MRGRVNALDPQMLQTAMLAFVVVCAIGIGLAILDRVRRMMITPEEDETCDLRGSLEEAFESGEMDEEEMKRVRAVLDRNHGDAPGSSEPKVPRF